MESEIIILYLIGSILVCAFALSFFNTHPGFSPKDDGVKEILQIKPALKPALPKYVTERSRYNFYAGIFVILTLLLYFFASFIFPYVVSNIFDITEVKLTEAAIVVTGTLAFIGLSPKIPVVGKLLESYKQSLYDKALIPDKGLNVFHYLMYGELNRQSEAFNRSLNTLLDNEHFKNVRNSLDNDYFQYDKATIERKWARLIYLIFVLEQWSKIHPFKRHINSEALCWLQIRAFCLETLLPRMIVFHRGQLNDGDKEVLHSLLNQTLIRVYWLITLLLFMSNKAGEDPVSHLKNIGWIVDISRIYRFTMNQVVKTGAVVLLSILTGAGFSILLFSNLDLNATVSPDALNNWLIFGIPMFVIPLFTTLYSKHIMSMQDMWEVVRPEPTRADTAEGKWATYIMVAVIAYLATVMILLMIATFIPGKPVAELISPLLMYSVLAFVTSMYICYLLDNPTPGWNKDTRFYIVSFLSACMHGASNVVIITYSVFYFSEIKIFDYSYLTEVEQGKLLAYSVTAFLIGFAMHLVLRRNFSGYDRREDIRESDSASWLTLDIGNISRRVKLLSESEQAIVVPASDEIRNLADRYDEVSVRYSNEPSKKGKITGFFDANMEIGLVS